MESPPEEVCEALADLRLIDSSFTPSSLLQEPPHPIYQQLLGTISEELNPYAFPFDPSQSSELFYQHLCAFLTSLGQPTTSLSTSAQCLSALDFLATELQTQRLRTYARTKSLCYPQDDTQIAAGLSSIAGSLNVSPDSLAGVKSMPQIYGLLKSFKDKVKVVVEEKGVELLLEDVEYTDEQLASLKDLNDRLCNEYKLRRGLLLKRLFVTVQSFLYSPRAKGHEDEFHRRLRGVYNGVALRNQLPTSVIDAMVCDVVVLENEGKIEVGRREIVGGKSVKSVIMGKVPDRGGRVGADGEVMPGFRKRVEGGGDRGQWKLGRGKGKKKKGKRR
eukprot:Plantae.Rhodophyta-Hildenbrandia_rubra.ctg12287.p2 GENE.Plantae.Rhodophyta-Hildenbrandia_rubra.ctg12287~~Plantae.Rhodophyta-Hildenbrandia_rubra.ctg12287.p2  ORF type:complete len:350 (-),score=63.30 Plantae.Rhodophyta-Hildenbrandia_rubra.ctg12287:2742-3737(-)